MCVCLFSSHLFRVSSSLDVPAGVTQEEGDTGFLIPLLSAVRALIFLAIRIQPFLSLGDREVELVYQRFNRSPHVGHFIFYFLVRKIPLTGIRTHVPTCQKVTRLLLNDRSDPCPDQNVLVPSIYIVEGKGGLRLLLIIIVDQIHFVFQRPHEIQFEDAAKRASADLKTPYITDEYSRFPRSAGQERDWPPCKVSTSAYYVRVQSIKSIRVR